jgi:hypothetical protein
VGLSARAPDTAKARERVRERAIILIDINHIYAPLKM